MLTSLSALAAGSTFAVRVARTLSVEIRILGPVQVLVSGQSLQLRGRQPRALVAMLALGAGRLVSLDRLIDGLWGDAPPPTATKMVQLYVSQVRKLLGGSADAGIATRGRGYELQVDPAQVDALRFERLVDEAVDSNPAAAHAALALWRGPALADVAEEPFAAAEIRRLEELHLRAIELSVDSDLAEGRHGAVIGRLGTLVAEHPLRERFHTQRMLALYRAGRQGDALAAYRDARRVLVEEIGAEPGAELREMHAAVLAQDPGLTLRVRGPALQQRKQRTSISGTDAGRPLLERSGELDRIEHLVAAAAGGAGTVAIVEAPAGLGKTRLLAAAREIAGRHGVAVLAARCSLLERDFGFGAVRQLLEPLVHGASEPKRDRLFGGAAGLARSLLLGDGGPAAAPRADALFRTLHGLYWLLANAAEEAPLMLLVDDLHWADEASQRFLAYLSARLEGLPVLVLAASRPPAELPTGDALDTLRSDPGIQRLSPQPLSVEAARSLTESLVGRKPERGFVSACWEVTGGNPLFLVQLLQELARSQVTPDNGSVGRVRGAGAASVGRVVLARLALLGGDSTSLARALCVLDDGVSLLLAAELAGVELEAAERAAEALTRASLLRRSETLEFVHPVVREAIAEDIPAHVRAPRHLTAARLLHDRGASTERVAAQLLKAPPGSRAWGVDVLRQAARRAGGQGATEAAIRYLRAVLEEQLEDSVRFDVLLELGSAEAAGWDQQAIGHLREALALARTAEQSAAAALTLGEALQLAGEFEAAFEVTSEVAGALVDDTSQALLELQAFVHGSSYLSGHGVETAALARRFERSLSADSPAARTVLGAISFRPLFGAEPRQHVLRTVARALVDDHLEINPRQLFSGDRPGIVLMWIDELDRADRLFTEAMDDARRRGSQRALSYFAALRGYGRHRAGDLVRAPADLEQALTADTNTGFGFGALVASIAQVLLLVDRGEPEKGERLAAEVPLPPDLDSFPIVALLRYAQGSAQLVAGRCEDAARTLEAAGRELTRSGVLAPTVAPWRSDLALARAAAGRDDDALRLVRDELELAERSQVDRARGVALRVFGLLEGGGEGIGLLKRSVAVLEGTPARLEHARSLVELGAAMRRASRNKESRWPLQRGLDIAADCRAEALADRARVELAATGARPRELVRSGLDALTPGELRVAQMAGERMTNRAIAQALFVTEKSVDSHLASVFRKLDISMRSELPRALAPDRDVAASA